MPTLYVENVPVALYEALRGRARIRHRSIAAEVLALLEENIPTQHELKARRAFLRAAERMRSKKTRMKRGIVPAEELQRQDRER
jgi:plasmid stability protein